MNLKRGLVSLGMSAAMLATLGVGLAVAAPVNAQGPNVSVQDVNCGGDIYTIATNGNDKITTAAHIVAINGEPASGIQIPVGVSYTGTVDGQPVSGSIPKPGNRNGITNTLECSFDVPEGTITVTVFQAGESR